MDVVVLSDPQQAVFGPHHFSSNEGFSAHGNKLSAINRRTATEESACSRRVPGFLDVLKEVTELLGKLRWVQLNAITGLGSRVDCAPGCTNEFPQYVKFIEQIQTYFSGNSSSGGKEQSDGLESVLELANTKSNISYSRSLAHWPSPTSTACLVSGSLSVCGFPVQSSLRSSVFTECKGAGSEPNINESDARCLRSQVVKASGHSYHDLPHQVVPTPVAKLSGRNKRRRIENVLEIASYSTVEADVDQDCEAISTLLDHAVEDPEPSLANDDYDSGMPSHMNIAMLVVGTRGDVQPFIAIGRRLQDKGHRVRLATHANFREFVTLNGLEFYPLDGDPKELVGYMVKNKGFLPSGPADVSLQKKQLKAIMNSLLPACTEPDGESGSTFKADSIIANPTAYGHVHVAEYLNVPLHIFFTMPWTPTSEFPHPLARVKRQAGYWMSYVLFNTFMWWGTRDIVNEFRVNKLKLAPITYFSMNQGSIAHLPTGYLWSPHLVPKPKDWGPKVDVVGYCFLNQASEYRPPDALVKWLESGKRPIYFGFGSLPIEDPGSMTNIIVQALQETNQRGIIDKGWGGLGNLKEESDSIFLLENCPHDWLFPQCAAVVHHGGAGTTAAGLKAGCPTTIVPFFGDQWFWGDRVYKKGIGPQPIPIQQFATQRIVDAINFMLVPEVRQRAVELARQIGEEDGVEAAVDAFYRHWARTLCSLSPATDPPNLLHTILSMVQKFTCLPLCI